MPNALEPIALAPNWGLFVEQIALGTSPTEAAKSLGWTDPGRTAAALLSMPLVRKALVAATEARLESRAAPMAAQVIEEILSDPDAPKAVRAKLAIAVLDRIRADKPKPNEGGAPDRAMNTEDLAALVERLETALLIPAPRDVTPRVAPG
jgi:hypothetical protein